jgi:hypothetical protein
MSKETTNRDRRPANAHYDPALGPLKKITFNPSRGTHIESAPQERFIRGPIPYEWMQRANSLPGKTGYVGLALWFLVGVKKSYTIKVTRECMDLAGLCRQSFRTGLTHLATAGLITLECKSGCRPLVTIQTASSKI